MVSQLDDLFPIAKTDFVLVPSVTVYLFLLCRNGQIGTIGPTTGVAGYNQKLLDKDGGGNFKLFLTT